jgi:hypothetical protein
MGGYGPALVASGLAPHPVVECRWVEAVGRRPDTGRQSAECGSASADQRVRSASAAFTAALAWSAPRTEIEAIVA